MFEHYTVFSYLCGSQVALGSFLIDSSAIYGAAALKSHYGDVILSVFLFILLAVCVLLWLLRRTRFVSTSKDCRKATFVESPLAVRHQGFTCYFNWGKPIEVSSRQGLNYDGLLLNCGKFVHVIDKVYIIWRSLSMG